MENWLCLSSLLLLAVLALLLECGGCESRGPVVVTKTGRLRGKILHYKGTRVVGYFGIPYATPPVGHLRFKRTVPVKKWHGTRDATKFPPACFQSPAKTESLDDTSVECEDCLYLNVWTPSTGNTKEKKSVMLWIHGGYFSQGSASKPLYDGTYLAAMGDVTVVTINYRLGIVGFLTSTTKDAPGNAALYDQVEALKWIKENIGVFGGDADAITVFGESAGAVSVSDHAVSPLAKGLFQRVILESGSGAFLITENNAVSLPTAINFVYSNLTSTAYGCSSETINLLTCPKSVVACLRKADLKKLTNLSAPYIFWPQYGDPYLPRNSREEIIDGNFKNCDLFIGVNADEGSVAFEKVFINMYGINRVKNNHPRLSKREGRDLLTPTLLSFGIDPDSVQAIIEYYLNKAKGDNNEEVVRQVYTAVGDTAILCPTVYAAEKSAQQGNNVFFYLFAHRPESSITAKWLGVTHFSEIQFVFGRPIFQVRGQHVKYTTEEKILSERMAKMWTNFGKTGSPQIEGMPPWPRYSRERPLHVILNTTRHLQIGYGPSRENCDFLRPYFGFD